MYTIHEQHLSSRPFPLAAYGGAATDSPSLERRDARLLALLPSPHFTICYKSRVIREHELAFFMETLSMEARYLNSCESHQTQPNAEVVSWFSITSFHKDCFSGMPNLMRLSMSERRVDNLWTTIAVLSKLPSLVEL
ncbi:3'-5' exonuclease domain-containing protein [Psidium guajava]|nr:3'-5' exonuclease domain-containing protein [Psidium guajava]